MTAISSANFIALTPGEPAGIGPDICIKLSQAFINDSHPVFENATPVFIADPQLLESRAGLLSADLPIRNFAEFTPTEKAMWVVPVSMEVMSDCGELNPDNARYVLSCLDQAIHGCLDQTFNALVTGPLQKSTINDAGIAFSGHTEYLAAACQREKVVMMLATETLRVALVTTHLPLSKVPAAITEQNLEHTLRILQHDLISKFSISQPDILVLGLNPHAGEAGHLGTEEIDVIQPVINKLKAEGFNLHGPLPADTAFTPQHLARADAVLAMYHDQGLPVLKSQGFGEAVNITLGLPIIRTSVDHGTALDLAGTGKADAGSLFSAFAMAAQMSSTQLR